MKAGISDSHRVLCQSLAASRNHDRFLVEVEIGVGFGFADVLAVARSYANKEIIIFEVKASTSDLLADLRAEKWRKYLPCANRVVFAVGPEVDWKPHLPQVEEVGIVRYHKESWTTVRRGPTREATDEMGTMIALSMRLASHERLRENHLKRHVQNMEMAAKGYAHGRLAKSFLHREIERYERGKQEYYEAMRKAYDVKHYAGDES